jgi:hypothetical protein
MNTGKISVLMAFVCFATTASELRAQSHTVSVAAEKQSVDTGVVVEKGDFIEVVGISGSVFDTKPTEGAKGIGYHGKENTAPSNGNFLYPKMGQHSLLGFVKDGTNEFQVRTNVGVEALQSGNLFFAFNDWASHYHDNEGAFEVTFKVTKKEKVRSLPSEKKVEIKWTNKSKAPVLINWINFEGVEEKSDRVIENDGLFDGISFVDHVFRVRDAKTNADLGLIFVKESNGNFEFVR